LYLALKAAAPLFVLPRDKIAQSVISPAMSASRKVDIMMGFFSSGSFTDIAPGLAGFLTNSDQALRLIISPFLSAQDQQAFEAAVDDRDRQIERYFDLAFLDADIIAKHTLKCLAWLVATKRLSIRIALVKGALFHSKVWLFQADSSMAALHGSANMTGRGLGANREQLGLARSWSGPDAQQTCRMLADEFESLWAGGDEACITWDLPVAIERKLLQNYKGDNPPNEAEFDILWRRSHGLTDNADSIADLLRVEQARRFHIPEWLNYETGEYAHQGQAVVAWEESARRGILEMCTGSGKTLTSLVCAQRLFEHTNQKLLVVLTAPYNVLLSQWATEMKLFGLRPINMSECNGAGARTREITQAIRRLNMGTSGCEAIIVSNDTLTTAEFLDAIEKYSGAKLLIADECHNLGAQSFTDAAPEFFDYRLGLSATPVRQYDEEGTDALFAYFGDPCFSFTLEQAIGVCLTPYDYYAHFVELSASEMDDWRDLSEKISQNAWKFKSKQDDPYLQSLILARRRLLETAEKKAHDLEALLAKTDADEIRYTLIYTTDKDPAQIETVNAMLSRRGIMFHQLTAEETSSPEKTKSILERFQDGVLQVLTAKRVLDEGVNVPQIMQAYILASTTVKRQWVQRRGRLLRTCKAIGKEFAVIHDFVALPPHALDGDKLDPDERRIVDSELERVWEFGRLSRNRAAPGGPYQIADQMRRAIGG
tara:strand:- start:472 stop:2604 length:2133 start_codon:yes stop_codon:yes gene_type:complete